MKKIIMILLALGLILPSLSFAEEMKEEDKSMAYEKIQAEVQSLGENGILVKEENGDLFILTEGVKVMDLEKGEFVEGVEFKAGQKLEIYIRNNTPFLTSLPAQVRPQLIAINSGKNYSLDMDFFKENGESLGGRLTILGLDEAKIFDLAGDERTAEETKNKELIVLYKIATRSIPPQTNPEKVYIWEEAKMDLDESDFNDFLEMGQDQKVFPLRKIFESLGVKVGWDRENKEVLLEASQKKARIITMEKKFVVGEHNFDLENFMAKDGVSYLDREMIEKIWDLIK